jgi:hypothetical protein
MSAKVCPCKDIVQLAWYATCAATVGACALHFYLIIFEFIIADNTVNTGQRSRQQTWTLRMSSRYQDRACVPGRNTCLCDKLSAGAWRQSQAQIDNVTALGGSLQDSPGNQGGVSGEPAIKYTHGKKRGLGQRLAQNSRDGGTVAYGVAEITIFTNFFMIIEINPASAHLAANV